MLILFIFLNLMMQITMADVVFYYWLCKPNNKYAKGIEDRINKTFKL